MTHARLARKVPPSFSLLAEFAMPPGVTVLLGPAGAGKTLILDLLAGFVRPDTGRILIDDAIVFDRESRVNLPSRRRRVAHVSSKDTLFPHLSVRDNLMFGAGHWPRLERHKRVAEMVDHFALDDTPSSRAAARIARAILAEPKLLLIDECGVDDLLLSRITAVFDGPVLLVTGDLDLCCAADTGLLLLEAGRIVQRGPAREIIDAPESLEAARLLGFANIFPASVTALDPGRNTSRLQGEHFALIGPYLPGHFNGDRVQVAIRAEDVRVHSGEIEPGANYVALPLTSVSERTRTVRLTFAHGIAAAASREQWERQRDNKRWQVEFPPAALRVF